MNAITAFRTNFSNALLPSYVVNAESEFYLKGRCLIVNFGATRVQLHNYQHTILLPFSSLIRCNEFITPTQKILVFVLSDCLEKNSELMVWSHQTPYTGHRSQSDELNQTDPIHFFRSPQAEIETLIFDPLFLAAGGKSQGHQHFAVKANLWFAQQGTHCGIHNTHHFIEIHTQVLGRGRMQIFQAPAFSSLKEEIVMASGDTTSRAFCHFESDEQPIYPYHQYYADTDSVWLALEYHPL